MAREVVPTTKAEEALVAKGRAEANARANAKEAKEALEKVEKDRNAAKRAANAAMAEIEEGNLVHRATVVGTTTIGAGAGLAAQHYGIEKTTIESKAAKAAILPGIGALVGLGGFVLGGIAGNAITGFGVGFALGSGLYSASKKLIVG